MAIPVGVRTYNRPVVAPAGTLARTCVALSTVAGVEVALNRIVVAPVKLVPVIVTLVPDTPLVGVNDVIVGAAPVVMVKLVALLPVPDVLVTESGPVVALAGTTAVSWVAEL